VTTLETLLTSRASFVLAALAVTWVAVLLLAIVAGHLHARLQRLERAGASTRQTRPYSELVGRRMGDLLGETDPHSPPRVVLFLSAACRACANLLEELSGPTWARLPSAIVWTDRQPELAPATPGRAHIVVDGPTVSARLGIRVTPFALLSAPDGTVLHAGPLNTLRSLDALLRTAPAASPVHVPGHASQEVARESRA
jgi:hypothetical protein